MLLGAAANKIREAAERRPSHADSEFGRYVANKKRGATEPRDRPSPNRETNQAADQGAAPRGPRVRVAPVDESASHEVEVDQRRRRHGQR